MKKKYLFLLPVVLILGCFKPYGIKAQDKNSIMPKTKIPDFIIAKSDSLIISKTGVTIFHKYIKYDSSSSAFVPNAFCYPCVHYNMFYTFKIPEKPWVDEIIGFNLDSTGNLITSNPTCHGSREWPEGIPECVLDPSCCIFGIDSAMAVDIAKEAGIREGNAPLSASFGWSGGKVMKYTWNVKNSLSQDPTKGGGQCFSIDANSGIVLGTGKWESNIFLSKDSIKTISPKK